MSKVIAIAETASEALLALEKYGEDWDLAVVDLFLKSGSGLTILRACQTSGSHQHVVVLTNYLTSEMRRRCLELGADAVFDKSSELDAFFEHCNSARTQARKQPKEATLNFCRSISALLNCKPAGAICSIGLVIVEKEVDMRPPLPMPASTAMCPSRSTSKRPGATSSVMQNAVTPSAAPVASTRLTAAKNVRRRSGSSARRSRIRHTCVLPHDVSGALRLRLHPRPMGTAQPSSWPNRSAGSSANLRPANTAGSIDRAWLACQGSVSAD